MSSYDSPVFDKPAIAVLDYSRSWAMWVEQEGETPTDVTWTAPAGITITNQAWDPITATATVWLAGGTLDHRYPIIATATAPSGRVDQDSITISVVHP